MECPPSAHTTTPWPASRSLDGVLSQLSPSSKHMEWTLQVLGHCVGGKHLGVEFDKAGLSVGRMVQLNLLVWQKQWCTALLEARDVDCSLPHARAALGGTNPQNMLMNVACPAFIRLHDVHIPTPTPPPAICSVWAHP